MSGALLKAEEFSDPKVWAKQPIGEYVTITDDTIETTKVVSIGDVLGLSGKYQQLDNAHKAYVDVVNNVGVNKLHDIISLQAWPELIDTTVGSKSNEIFQGASRSIQGRIIHNLVIDDDTFEDTYLKFADLWMSGDSRYTELFVSISDDTKRGTDEIMLVRHDPNTPRSSDIIYRKVNLEAKSYKKLSSTLHSNLIKGGDQAFKRGSNGEKYFLSQENVLKQGLIGRMSTKELTTLYQEIDQTLDENVVTAMSANLPDHLAKQFHEIYEIRHNDLYGSQKHQKWLDFMDDPETQKQLTFAYMKATNIDRLHNIATDIKKGRIKAPLDSDPVEPKGGFFIGGDNDDFNLGPNRESTLWNHKASSNGDYLNNIQKTSGNVGGSES